MASTAPTSSRRGRRHARRQLARRHPRVQPPAPARPEVLVADDDPSSRRVLCAVLEASGFTSRQAKDGKDALTAIAKALPDIVLLDLEMPGINGAEVCTRLRHDNRPEVREIPVIAACRTV